MLKFYTAISINWSIEFISTNNVKTRFDPSPQFANWDSMGTSINLSNVNAKLKWASLFFFNFWRTLVIFVGPLIPLLWTSGDVSSGFQSQNAQPCSRLVEAYMLHGRTGNFMLHCLVDLKLKFQAYNFSKLSQFVSSWLNYFWHPNCAILLGTRSRLTWDSGDIDTLDSLSVTDYLLFKQLFVPAFNSKTKQDLCVYLNFSTKITDLEVRHPNRTE